MFAILLIALTLVVSWYIQEGFGDQLDNTTPVNIAYWLCEVQVDDFDALRNALYHPVQTFATVRQMFLTIKEQNGGTRQGYHIRRMMPNGKIGPLVMPKGEMKVGKMIPVTDIYAETEAQTIYNEWKKTPTNTKDYDNYFHEWKGKHIYDKVFSLGDNVSFFKDGNWISGTVTARSAGKDENGGDRNGNDYRHTLSGLSQETLETLNNNGDPLETLKLNDMRYPPTFVITGENMEKHTGIPFEKLRIDPNNDPKGKKSKQKVNPVENIKKPEKSTENSEDQNPEILQDRDRIEVNYQGQGDWYNARIQRQDNNWVIEYDDGEIVKIIGEYDDGLANGDEILVQYESDQEYNAVIKKKEDSFKLVFSDFLRSNGKKVVETIRKLAS